MKKLILGLGLIALLGVQLFSQAVVIYNSDDPFSSAAAAVVDQKYGVNYLLDCAENDSAAQVAWFATLPADTTLTYAFVVADTASPYEADKYLSTYLDSIDIQVLGDSAVTYYLGSANATKCEMTWNSLYADITPPLIIGYLSEGNVWYDRADASGGTDSTIFKANATGWTSDEWIGDYVVITAGPNIGEGREIEDVIADVSGDADTIEVSSAFTAAITSSSDFTVVPSSLYTNWQFYDMYAYYAVLVKIADVSLNRRSWGRLLDNDGRLNSLVSGATGQDLSYLEDLVEAGEEIMDYLIETN